MCLLHIQNGRSKWLCWFGVFMCWTIILFWGISCLSRMLLGFSGNSIKQLFEGVLFKPLPFCVANKAGKWVMLCFIHLKVAYKHLSGDSWGKHKVIWKMWSLISILCDSTVQSTVTVVMLTESQYSEMQVTIVICLGKFLWAGTKDCVYDLQYT